MAVLAMRLVAIVVAAASFGSGFTAAQSRSLAALTMPVVLPSHVPSGFHVTHVEALRGQGCATCENYRVVYQSGNAVLEFAGSNWTAGGDADEDAFAAQFDSPLFGTGVVSMVRDVALDRTRLHSNCLTAYQRRGSATSFFLTLDSKYFFSVRACDSSLSPSDLARVVESAGIVRR